MNRQQFIGQRIRMARENLGWSQQYLSQLYGCSDVTISRLERGIVGISISDLERLAAILHQSISFFLAEDVQYEQRPLEAIIKELEAIQPIAIPVFGQEASAGGGSPIQEYAYWSPPRAAGKNIKAIKVRGQCLSPTLDDGDVVFFDTDASPEDGQLVVALIDNTLRVKRFRERGSEKWLESNSEPIDFDEGHIQGVIVSFERWLT